MITQKENVQEVLDPLENKKQTELKGKCKNCLGCQRLEDENFKGIERCEWRKENE